MSAIQLAPNLVVSRLVNGLWQIADRERGGVSVDPQEAAHSMLPLVEQGLTTFDMADHYGSSEEIVGWFRKLYPQKKIQSLTKWVPKPGTITKQDVREAVTRALTRLQTEQIDLMQFHAWNYPDPSWLDGLFYLKELKDEGLILELGVTNFDTAHLRVALASGIPLVSNQVCFSLLDQRAAGDMSTLCASHKVKLLAFGTLAGGFLSDRWLGKPEPILNESLTWSQMKYKRFIDAAGGWQSFQKLLMILNEVSKRNQTSIANLATRMMLEEPSVGAVIIGTRLNGHDTWDENKRILHMSLAASDKQEIKEALKIFMAIPGDCGDEYRKPPFLTASGDLSHHVENFPKPYSIKSVNIGQEHVMSGTVWEELAGFSRAVKIGNRILISGTTATHNNQVVGGNDPAAQTTFILDKIEGALQTLGASLQQVVRTRIYLRHVSDWEVVARVHGQRFRYIQPANTMVRADLIGDEYLVEIEAEAEI
jgi:aryl-alcohol dehydrogenase-like predicted oxidoreductase/enamine deaminase RidA (YjgF/YER057c/UK114 family)